MSVLLMLAVSLQGISASLVMKKEYPGKAYKVVEVKNPNGDISVRASEGQLRFEAWGKSKEEAEVVFEESGSRLVITVVPKAGFFFSSGSWDVTLSLPREPLVDLAVRTGSGDISVDAQLRELAVFTGSGEVSLSGQFAKLNTRSGSGDVLQKSEVKEANMRLGSGNLNYYNKVSAGQVRLQLGSGDAHVHFRESDAVDSKLSVGSGSLLNELKADKTAPLKLRAMSGSGNLKVLNY